MEGEWPRVAELVRRYVDSRVLPGAVATLGWGDAPAGSVARGSEAFDDDDPVGPDSLFRIYSMTKPVTGMAAMMLIDEGAMRLDQPLADILPQFAAMRVALDPAKGLESRPARTTITIRHLLTHTAGFGYGGVGRDRVSLELLRLGLAPGIVSRLALPGLTPPVPTPGAAEFLRLAATVPLLAEPGTRWAYSMGLDILGLAIEQVTGQGLADVLQQRIFDPCGMESTGFTVPRARTGRMTANYGLLAGLPLPLDRPADSVFLDPPPFAFGGAGLVSTPADYDRFLRMLLNGGRVGTRQVIGARALETGLSDLLPPGVDTRGTPVAGAGFGAGGRVGLDGDAGSFGWSGAAGTLGLINTRIGLRAGLYVQFMPPGAIPIQREFMAATRDDAEGTAGIAARRRMRL